MAKELTIREVLEGNFDDYFNFYDWFCSDNSLEKRAKSLVSKLKFLVKEGLVNPDTNRVWFKNNCPCNGSLYDDLRITRISDDKFLGGFCPSSGHNSIKGQMSFWILVPEYRTYEFENWSSFKNQVKNDEKLRTTISSVFN